MLIHKEKSGNITWAVWKIEEDIETLFSMLNNISELLIFREKTQSESRIKERLAVRVLLKELTGEEKDIQYTLNGKPYFADQSIQISISHTKGYAAIALSPNDHTGIDIEYISDRVKRIRSRFIGELEFIDPDNEVLHLLLHWSAKESVYKAINKEGVDLKQDFVVEKFIPEKKGSFKAYETHSENKLRFTIQYSLEKDYVLTLATPEI